MKTLCRDCGREPPLDAEACPACGSVRVVRHQELHDLAIAHLDCDAFYAAIEKRDRPELRDVPVIVGGRHRGVVAACCYIARTYGVRSAMPMFKALKACPDATVIKPDMKKYTAVGREVRAMMLSLTPLVEPLSIDEAFMDLASTESLHGASPATTLAALARRVEEELAITVSIGLSYNKFLAKIASDLDKPRGFAVIGRAEAESFLADKQVGAVVGSGPGSAAAPRWGRHHADRRTRPRRGGRACRPLRQDRQTAVAVRPRRGRTPRSTPAARPRACHRRPPSTKTSPIWRSCCAILWQLAETVARRMKKSGIAGEGVTLKLKTSDFRTITRARHLKNATQSGEESSGPPNLSSPARPTGVPSA